MELTYEEAADRLLLPRLEAGDTVTCDAHDQPLIVERVGYHGAPSPFYGDHEWKAWCVSATWDDDHFADWLPVTALVKV